jgi:hypothetical protein
VRTSAETEGLQERVQGLKFDLQISESERSVARDKMLSVFEAAKSLGKEAGVAVADARRALEHEKRNSFVVDQVLGQLQVGVLNAHEREVGESELLSVIYSPTFASLTFAP